MSGKNKNKKPYRSLLDEPLLGSDAPEEDSSDEQLDGNGVLAGSFIVDLGEDDSISDLPEKALLSEEDQETDDEYYPEGDGQEEYFSAPGERFISRVTTIMMVLLMGGSLVFWWAIASNLMRTPFALADSTQMRVLLASCAGFSLLYTIIQWKRGRDTSAEQLMACLCVSGLFTVLTVIITQALIRHVGYGVKDLPLTLCCAVSGCALPAFVFMLLRRLIERFAYGVEYEKSKDWETVRSDVLSLTDFGKKA